MDTEIRKKSLETDPYLLSVLVGATASDEVQLKVKSRKSTSNYKCGSTMYVRAERRSSKTQAHIEAIYCVPEALECSC